MEKKKPSQVAGTTNEDKKIKGITIQLTNRDIQLTKAKRNWLKRLLDRILYR